MNKTSIIIKNLVVIKDSNLTRVVSFKTSCAKPTLSPPKKPFLPLIYLDLILILESVMTDYDRVIIYQRYDKNKSIS